MHVAPAKSSTSSRQETNSLDVSLDLSDSGEESSVKNGTSFDLILCV